MKLSEIFNELLGESILKSPFKGRNVLYHSSGFGQGIDILTDNRINAATKQTISTKLNPSNPNYNVDSKNYNGVSLTRDNRLNFNNMEFILDGDLIKRNFGNKLVPHDFYKPYGNKTKANNNRSDAYESEEFLIGDLKPLSKYLIAIRFTPRYETLEEFRTNDPEGYDLLKKTIGNIPTYDENFNQITL
jgi:hypothetical protein